jgi:hypothetical protein
MNFKKILLIVLIAFSSINLIGQFDFKNDSIQTTQTIEIDEIEHVRICLDNHRKQKMNGYAVNLIGLTMTSLGGIISTNSYGRISQNSGSALYMIGAGTLLIGTIITIDSNKWFNRKRTIKTSLE